MSNKPYLTERRQIDGKTVTVVWFTRDNVKNYLDSVIEYYRRKKQSYDSQYDRAICNAKIAMAQEMKQNLFGSK